MAYFSVTDLLPDFEGYSSDAVYYEREGMPDEAQRWRDTRWDEWDGAIGEAYGEQD